MIAVVPTCLASVQENPHRFVSLWDIMNQFTAPALIEKLQVLGTIGTVTLFQATHHGFVNDFSGSPAHVLALKPRVVIVNNGPTKGWQNSAWDTVAKIPGLEDVWQIHAAMGPTTITT